MLHIFIDHKVIYCHEKYKLRQKWNRNTITQGWCSISLSFSHSLSNYFALSPNEYQLEKLSWIIISGQLICFQYHHSVLRIDNSDPVFKMWIINLQYLQLKFEFKLHCLVHHFETISHQLTPQILHWCIPPCFKNIKQKLFTWSLKVVENTLSVKLNQPI